VSRDIEQKKIEKRNNYISTTVSRCKDASFANLATTKPTCSFTRCVARWYQSHCRMAAALAQTTARESVTSGVFVVVVAVVVVDMVAGVVVGQGEKAA
jgi:hypothetical protein